jgi:hypothetical protein
MKINLAPIRMDEQLEVKVNGDSIWLNGEEFDFSPLPDGAILPHGAIDSKWFVGKVYRINGQIELTILLPHGSNAPHETRFPNPITVTTDGVVDLPPYNIPQEEVSEVLDED